MLLEFSVTNYRSIRDTQTLRMAASNYYKGLEETNCFDAGVNGLPKLLRAAVIYGPNAAGKSNLFRALHFMQNFVLQSHSHQEGQTINAAPFALDGRRKKSRASSRFSLFRMMCAISMALRSTGCASPKSGCWPFRRERRSAGTSGNMTPKRTRIGGISEASSPAAASFGRKQPERTPFSFQGPFNSTTNSSNRFSTGFRTGLPSSCPAPRSICRLSIDQCTSEEGMQRIMNFMNSADTRHLGS